MQMSKPEHSHGMLNLIDLAAQMKLKAGLLDTDTDLREGPGRR